MSDQVRRSARVERITRETDIRLSLALDGSGQADVGSGVGFMDHMLTLLVVHGFFDLTLQVRGDTHIDDHHSVEDTGICLGQAFAKALGDKGGIYRYGHAYVPMDETLARVCLDLSNRPYLHYQTPPLPEKIGTFDSCLAREFLRAFSLHAGCTLHVDVLHGEDGHHIIEAVFKALGQALRQATTPLPGLAGQLSSKGTL
ncbi:MAG: imidazoleglycerol-phosphate dehydratase HisB [Desulfobulbaceae bacterium]|nr:imidazoleglycerol-phosphate dehydratase HisB [Desulfobulbaceae bacterium]